jgi:hypothetical protein
MGKLDRKLKRNWKVWNLAYKYEDEWFLERARETIKRMPNPWERSEMGRPPKHSAKGLFLACVYKVKKRLSYRGLESELISNEGLPRKLLLEGPVSKSTLQEAMARITGGYADAFLARLNDALKKRPTSRR